MMVKMETHNDERLLTTPKIDKALEMMRKRLLPAGDRMLNDTQEGGGEKEDGEVCFGKEEYREEEREEERRENVLVSEANLHNSGQSSGLFSGLAALARLKLKEKGKC